MNVFYHINLVLIIVSFPHGKSCQSALQRSEQNTLLIYRNHLALFISTIDPYGSVRNHFYHQDQTNGHIV